MNIAAPLIAFLAALRGPPMLAILTSLAIAGLIGVKVDGGRHQQAMGYFIGFLIMAGVIIAVLSEGAAFFQGA